MTIKFGVIMDPLESINPKKDTTFAVMLKAQQRQWEVFYIPFNQLFLENNRIKAQMSRVTLKDQINDYYQLESTVLQSLEAIDIIFMRKDPPFNMEYIYLTYLLQKVAERGVRVINNPQSVRDANEKLFATWFPQCCPDTVVTSQSEIIKSFSKKNEAIVIKPLDSMGGHSIFYTNKNDKNLNVIIDTLTHGQTQLVMAQTFIPAIKQGDKRLLLINGEPIDYVLARIPHADDFRGNLAAGAHSEGRELSDRDRWIAAQVGSTLRAKGLSFVGLDIIGDYLTEINVTSPTCVRELERLYPIDICGKLLDFISEGL